MPKYYYARKKSKKKQETPNANAWMRTALYILMGALCVWLCAILWFNANSGKLGTTFAQALRQALGASAGLLPLFLGYLLDNHYYRWFVWIGCESD